MLETVTLVYKPNEMEMTMMFEKAGTYFEDIIYKDLRGNEKMIKSSFIISKPNDNT